MEIITPVILIVLLVLIIVIKGLLEKSIENTRRLRKQFESSIELLNSKIDRLSTNETIQKGPIPKESIQPIVAQKTEAPIAIKSPIPEVIPTVEIKNKPIELVQTESRKEIIPEVRKPIEIVQPKEPKQSFFDKNPDLEKFIGENLMNKIGIGILVLGIGFFVKYAISQGWISVEVRTAIGIVCGGILIGLAHKLRNTFAAFSSVLVGGGLAILYFTITIAFHEYHVFNKTAAFIIMMFITAFGVLLSISYDRKELAILALIGGFSSPFMVSTGDGNYIALFTYVAILNVGMLVLAYFKKWNIINIISYIFTIILYAAWFFSKVIFDPHPPLMGAFLFATIFYFIFFLMNIINNVKESRVFNALEISILLSNTFIYFSVGYYVFENLGEGLYKGLFTVLVGLFNFAFAYLLYKNEKADKNLVYMLIGLVLTFLSLAAPIQLNGNQITLFWTAEAVLLLWLSQKSGIKLLKQASILVLCLMSISLINDWQKIYFAFDVQKSNLSIIFNKGFITGIFSLAGILMTILLLKKETEKHVIRNLQTVEYRYFLSVLLILFGYIVFFLELRYQLKNLIDYYATRDIVIGSYNMLFLIGLNMYARKKETPIFLETSFALGLAGIISYPIFYHFMVINIRNSYIHGHGLLASYIFHFVLVLLVLLLILNCYKNMQLKSFILKQFNSAIMWFSCFMIVFIASAELDNLIAMSSDCSKETITYYLNQNHKIGFPILWGICSFALMIIGMRVKRRDLRIMSLSLFLVIILKLFFFDIRGISEGGKIAAFIFLGIILLIVSFMYQKLKKLVLEDKSEPNTPAE